jgi:hypothetical protein
VAISKLKITLFAATFAFGVSSLNLLSADDMMPPPPPGDDMMMPPGDDMMAPPPPGGDMMAPPPPGGDMMAPPPGDDMMMPPGDDMMAPPPGDEMMAPPGGDMMAPPPGDDMMMPPPGDDMAMPPGGDSLMPPPDDTQFTEAPKPSSSSGKTSSYKVRGGDSLWRIAGKGSIYSDSFKWPLIFIANRNRIKDPDIIRTNWNLKIARNQSATEVASAVRKAQDTPRYVPHTIERKNLPIEY